MYRKYRIEGLNDSISIKDLEQHMMNYQDIRHARIQKHVLIADSQNNLDIDDFNMWVKKFNPNVLISEMNKHNHNHLSHDNHTQKEEVQDLEHSIKFSISGLDCPNCAMKVEKVINELDYVDKAILNFSTQTLMVVSNEENLESKLQNVINTIEKGVTITAKKVHLEVPRLFVVKERLHLIIGLVCLILSVFIKVEAINFILILCAYMIIGYPVLYKAYKNILKGQIFDENFLMCIATIGALCIGEYFEAVAVMLFYSIGEIFQSYAVNKTRYSISDLMNIKSDYAYVYNGYEYVKKCPEDVSVGDRILVKAGEKVPLDGIIIEGQTSLDTSSMTGESLPQYVGINDKVLASSINLSDVIVVKVTHNYDDTAVSKIIDMVENAALHKAPLERFITRFAKVYTPSVVAMALILAFIPPMIIKDSSFYEWIYRALTFLVVSCPCALVVSIPLGLYAGIGKASQIGALVKGGNYLEYLKDIDTIVFDKTGTLTKGYFNVTQVIGDESLLEIASAIESMSNHPISKSIVSYYGKKNTKYTIKEFKEIAGQGISCKIDEDVYRLGNAKFLQNHDIVFDEENHNGTIVYISKNQMYLGAIVLEDEIKETSLQSIKCLKDLGIKRTVMLTGDRYEVASDIAEKLHIDDVYSQLLPQEKVTKLESLLENHKVAFVGDGINDAPVLARADIGIAMGNKGSDAAVLASDIVLMNDDIDTIVKTIQISKKTNRILKQNVVFTLFIKIGILILTMLGYSNMWMGVFADVGVTLLAILNSMRILK